MKIVNPHRRDTGLTKIQIDLHLPVMEADDQIRFCNVTLQATFAWVTHQSQHERLERRQIGPTIQLILDASFPLSPIKVMPASRLASCLAYKTPLSRPATTFPIKTSADW